MGMSAMSRRYIRHPSDIPIEVSATQLNPCPGTLHDMSRGGLAFKSESPLRPGHVVHIRIPNTRPPFDVQAQVVWCRQRAKGYDVGVQFSTPADRFRVRMIEQVCHIEHYRQEARRQGRELSAEDAAREWIERYASNFPRHDDHHDHR